MQKREAMFTGYISQWHMDRQYLPHAFDTAMCFLLHMNASRPEPGSYDIDGRNIYVNIEQGLTKHVAERRFELHRAYIDIQVLLEGSERQDYSALTPDVPPEEDRLTDADVAFFPAPATPQSLIMTPGCYAIYLPGELHAPNLAVTTPAHHLKAILKIRADILSAPR